MKKGLGWAVGAVLLVSAALLAIPASRDEIHWVWACRQNSASSFESYITTWPDGRHGIEGRTRYDEICWSDALAVGTVKALEEYVNEHPEGLHGSEAIRMQADLRGDLSLFTAVFEEGTPEALEEFLQNYPGHVREQAARDLFKIKGKAQVVLKYDRSVTGGSRYVIETVFEETGGFTGYHLESRDFYIRDPDGDRWTNNWSEEVYIEPGGTASISYWCDKSIHWSGGAYHVVWAGRDDLGNSIRKVQEVELEE